jgi:hypothetical protein
VTAALFGLFGVVVGALLQAVADFALARRQDTQIVRGAARMCGGELLRAMHRLQESVDSRAWGRLAIEPIDTPLWEQHQPLFAAMVASHERWFEIYSAHRKLGQVNEVAVTHRPDDTLSDGERRELKRLSVLAIRGAFGLLSIGMYGPRRWSVRRAIQRVRGLLPVNEEKLIAQVEAHLDPLQDVDLEDDEAPEPPDAPAR